MALYLLAQKYARCCFFLGVDHATHKYPGQSPRLNPVRSRGSIFDDGLDSARLANGRNGTWSSLVASTSKAFSPATWSCQKLHHFQYSRGGDCPREKKIWHLQVQRFWRSWPLPHLLEVDHWECQTYRPHCYSWAASPISVDLNLNVCISLKHILQIALF